MAAAKCLVASVLAAHASTGVHAFLGGIDMSTMMKLTAMSKQFQQDSIEKEQRVALMEHAGFNDMELFMSKQITAADFKKSVKQKMKDDMVQQMLNSGGLDLTNPWVRKTLFKDQDNAQLISRVTPEPMQSIIRLVKTEDTGKRFGSGGLSAADKTKARQYGKDLLKRYQYKKFNRQGNAITENIDHIMMAKGDDRKKIIKQVMMEEMYANVQDPIDRSMMFFLTQSRDATDAAEKTKFKQHIKDLQTIKIFQSQVPEASPVSDDSLYAFYKLVKGKISPQHILNLALGDKLGPINSELEFERYFGAPAKQFSCRAHSAVIKVPCGISLEADECIAAGCCYVPDSNTGIPSCYHDLYGKIGSSILRAEYSKQPGNVEAIKKLFPEGIIPSLDQILKLATPAMAELYKYDSASSEKWVPSGKMKITEYESKNWWDAAGINAAQFEAGPNGPDAFPQRGATMLFDGDGLEKINGQRPAYGNPRQRKWKAHGPTQSPFFDSLPGVNPTANPLQNGLGTLDEYYRIWLTYAEQQDQATCALIHKSSRVKCMPNYDALIDQATTAVGASSKCKAAGCCFNEDSFLGGGFACYRAVDYGLCTNLPKDHVKTECPGTKQGISESECTANPQCCFKYTTKNEPWCFKKYSATLDESQWCSAWQNPDHRSLARKECFVTTVGMTGFLGNKNNIASNVNNLVSKEQCESAGCCYDDTLTVDVIEWQMEGLGMNQNLFRCHVKNNPQIARAADFLTLPDEVAKPSGKQTDSGTLDGTPGGTKKDYFYSHQGKTCNQKNWYSQGGAQFVFKRSCGENISYYQCVYVKRCCFKATVANEPACYHPELSNTWKKPTGT